MSSPASGAKSCNIASVKNRSLACSPNASSMICSTSAKAEGSPPLAAGAARSRAALGALASWKMSDKSNTPAARKGRGTGAAPGSTHTTPTSWLKPVTQMSLKDKS
eukprot:3267490-Heterocapsa_arctica.AAC.1